MNNRVIEISSAGYYLSYKNKQLVISSKNDFVATVPVEDLSAVILDHPQCTITQTCLMRLVEAQVAVIVSDDSHMPIGMNLLLDGNSIQNERFRCQVQQKKPKLKRIWQQLIVSKVSLQGKILSDLHSNDGGLLALSKKVKSGDPDNIEAQAARRYWTRLFPNSGFKRDRNALDQNTFLNYLYSVLRALTARHLVAAGLHPSLGLHHHNKYNAFALADDIMEPFRPYVDLHVWEVTQIISPQNKLNANVRQSLLEWLQKKVMVENEQVSIQYAIQKTAQSLWQCYNDEREALILPCHG